MAKFWFSSGLWRKNWGTHWKSSSHSTLVRSAVEIYVGGHHGHNFNQRNRTAGPHSRHRHEERPAGKVQQAFHMFFLVRSTDQAEVILVQ